jgi:hypothetical protein
LDQPFASPVAELEEFMRNWRFHNKLKPEQVQYADQVKTVASVGYYNGGDPLYVLDGLSQYVWHEQNLKAAHELQSNLRLKDIVPPSSDRNER